MHIITDIHDNKFLFLKTRDPRYGFMDMSLKIGIIDLVSWHGKDDPSKEPNHARDERLDQKLQP